MCWCINFTLVSVSSLIPLLFHGQEISRSRKFQGSFNLYVHMLENLFSTKQGTTCDFLSVQTWYSSFMGLFSKSMENSSTFFYPFKVAIVENSLVLLSQKLNQSFFYWSSWHTRIWILAWLRTAQRQFTKSKDETAHLIDVFLNSHLRICKKWTRC